MNQKLGGTLMQPSLYIKAFNMGKRVWFLKVFELLPVKCAARSRKRAPALYRLMFKVLHR
jgi:hypothetical protein